jgi:hypothetical protein
VPSRTTPSVLLDTPACTKLSSKSSSFRAGRRGAAFAKRPLLHRFRSAGSAAAFGIDAVATPFLNEHLASFCMLLVSLPLIAIVVNSIEETSGNEVIVTEDGVRFEKSIL